MTSTPLPTLNRDDLVVGDVRVSFQRTLRTPEHGVHPLPPGLGRFPLRRVADYPDTAPSAWQETGGVICPSTSARRCGSRSTAPLPLR